MEHAEQAGARMTVAKVAFGLLAGLVVLVLLFPASGIDPIPPRCFSVFGYTVPCGGGLAVAAGAVTAGVVGVWLWLRRSRR